MSDSADRVEIEVLRGELTDAVMMRDRGRYRRTPEGWKFAERVFEVRYLDTTPLAGSAARQRQVPASPRPGGMTPARPGEGRAAGHSPLAVPGRRFRIRRTPLEAIPRPGGLAALVEAEEQLRAPPLRVVHFPDDAGHTAHDLAEARPALDLGHFPMLLSVTWPAPRP
jgi:hypothetical protein